MTLLDCFTIPAVMVLSWVIFRRVVLTQHTHAMLPAMLLAWAHLRTHIDSVRVLMPKLHA